MQTCLLKMVVAFVHHIEYGLFTLTRLYVGFNRVDHQIVRCAFFVCRKRFDAIALRLVEFDGDIDRAWAFEGFGSHGIEI